MPSAGHRRLSTPLPPPLPFASRAGVKGGEAAGASPLALDAGPTRSPTLEKAPDEAAASSAPRRRSSFSSLATPKPATPPVDFDSGFLHSGKCLETGRKTRQAMACPEGPGPGSSREEAMRLNDYNRLVALSRRSVIKGAAGSRGAGARLRRRARRHVAGRPGPGEPARRDPQDPRRRHGLAHRRRLAEGRRDVPRRHPRDRAGRRVRRGRAHLHGAQQPEPAQLPVPRLPQALGDLHRREAQLDRPRPGRLQRTAAAVDRHRHRRLRRDRDGRAVRGRRLRQGPRLGDARLGRRAHRHGRLRQLPEGAGRDLGRQDLPHLDRRRLPHLLLPHRRLLRPGLRRGVEGRRQHHRVGRADHLGAGAGGRRSSCTARPTRPSARRSTASSIR